MWRSKKIFYRTMHCAIKNAQFHSFVNGKKFMYTRITETWSHYRDDEQSISVTNFFFSQFFSSLKLMLNWFFKKSSCVLGIYICIYIYIVMFFFLFSFDWCNSYRYYFVHLCYKIGIDRCLLILMNSYVNRRKKKKKRKTYESYVPIYDGGEKIHFSFFLFFVFLADASRFFWEKVIL